MRKGGGAGPLFWLVLAGIVAAAVFVVMTHRDQFQALLHGAVRGVGHTEVGG